MLVRIISKDHGYIGMENVSPHTYLKAKGSVCGIVITGKELIDKGAKPEAFDPKTEYYFNNSLTL